MNLPEIVATYRFKELLIDRNFETLDALAVYGKLPGTTLGLTWGYCGGRWSGFSVAAGTLTLTNGATNYVVVLRSTGAISVSTTSTNWDNVVLYARVYKLTTAGSLVTVEEDHRAGVNGVHGPVAGGELRGLTFTADTDSTADSDPGAGLFKWNHATQTSATVLYFDDLTADGKSLTTLWGNLAETGFITLQQADDSTKWQEWRWSALPVDGTGYRKFTVALQASGGSIADAKLVLVDFESGVKGAMVGPSSSTDEAVQRFDGTTGKLSQNSVVTISDTGAIAGAISLSIASGTLTDSAPALNITQTWNDGTEAFIGATMNVTDTASAATALLERWQVGGNDVGNIGKGSTTTGVFGAQRVTVSNASAVGFLANITFPVTTLTSAEGFRSSPTLSDGSGATFAQVVGYRAIQPVKNGAGDTITKYSAFLASAATVGALNIGFEGALAVSGVARYNLYMSGTAPNYLAGQLLVGHTASVTTGQANIAQFSGSGSQTGGIGLNRYSADALATRLEFGKSRHATIGSNTIVQSGDEVLNISALGANGSTYDLCAQIIAEIAGTPGASADMPGRWRFLTSADGSATPSERFWIEPDGSLLWWAFRLTASNYSRFAFKSVTSTLVGVSGASVSAASLIPAKAVVFGVTTRVTSALGTGGGTSGYQVGEGIDPDRWGNITGTATGTQSDSDDYTADPHQYYNAANNVVLTAVGGNFNGTGNIRIDVYYYMTEAD